jgi:hypothetical protein
MQMPNLSSCLVTHPVGDVGFRTTSIFAIFRKTVKIGQARINTTSGKMNLNTGFVNFELLERAVANLQDPKDRLLFLYAEADHHSKIFLELSEHLDPDSEDLYGDLDVERYSVQREKWIGEYRFIRRIKNLILSCERENEDAIPIAGEFQSVREVLHQMDKQESTLAESTVEEDVTQSERGTTNELKNAQRLVLSMRDDKKALRQQINVMRQQLKEAGFVPSRETLLELIDSVRFLNGKINYSKLAKLLGRTNKTAKAWCRKYGVK